ncbi:Transmembrane protein [Parasponia andersonii]|uniref:Transmembrane protein n=1 Tax=Parasponia andersonii TaxID=3476 RepID=A0A2P5C6G0_PARAD|nr:Transmembrane protein [Parasponia andersonii]
MKSLSSVGIGLSVVFSCLFLALIAELYYLFWWKKRFTNREIENDYSSSPAKELFYMFCWRKHSAFTHSALNPQQLCSSNRISNTTLLQESNSQLHMTPNNDFLFKPFGEEGMEAEFMRLQNPLGPPRFLFTIIEETKEDLESEDGKSNKSRKVSRTRSLSDLLVAVETPYLTPLASPPFFTPPLTPGGSNGQNGFNFHFESTTDAEFNRLRSSPPPKFKFLQEAEKKLKKRRMEEEADSKGVQKIEGPIGDKVHEANTISSLLNDDDDDDRDESFIEITVDKNKPKEVIHHSSSSSQVIPLASSPSAFRSPIKKKSNSH